MALVSHEFGFWSTLRWYRVVVAQPMMHRALAAYQPSWRLQQAGVHCAQRRSILMEWNHD